MTVQPSGAKSAGDFGYRFAVGSAWTACFAMLSLIFLGGLVTGFRAGMAVPDWPGTYGCNMFVYPLYKMTGGIFYEHSHRLLGAVVGGATLVAAMVLTVMAILDSQWRWLRPAVLAWLVAVGVVVQGVMGGLRVTENSPNLAVFHGFFAHLVFAGMVAVAALVGRRTRDLPEDAGCNSADCLLSTLLVFGLLLQTLLGVFVRQKNVVLFEHVSVAMLVIVLAVLLGVRLWGLYPQIRVFARGGAALAGLVLLQLFLGGIALAVRTPPAVDSPPPEQMRTSAHLQPAWHAVLTTLHQTNAAVLLGLAMFLAVWCWRLRRVSASENASDIYSAYPATAESAQ